MAARRPAARHLRPGRAAPGGGPPIGLIRLPDAAAALEASGRDPLIAHVLRADSAEDSEWSEGAAVGLVRAWADERQVFVVGPPRDAARLATALARDAGLPVTLPVAALEYAPMSDAERWRFRWSTAVEPANGTASARWLEPGIDDEIQAFLDGAHAEASTRPGAPEIRRWAGIRDEAGALVATAADISRGEHVGHIASVATHADARARGFGAAISSWIAAQLIEQYGVATLGHYLTNATAERLYLRLGFTSLHDLASGMLA